MSNLNEPVVCCGAFRCVLVVGSLAFKFARSEIGARCNRYEADLFRRVRLWRKAMLCPIITCSPSSAVLLAKAATPLTQAEFDEVRKSDSFPEWDYQPLDGDGECPFEFHKPDDWGWLDGKLVAVDYSAPAIADPDEIQELMRNWDP